MSKQWQDSIGKDTPQVRNVGYGPVKKVGTHGRTDRDHNGKAPKLGGSYRKGK